MGSIRKRGDQYYIRYKDHTGKWVEKKSCNCKMTAKAALDKIELEVFSILKGWEQPPEKRVKTVEEYIVGYIESLRDHNRKPSHIIQTEKLIRRVIEVGKIADIKELTAEKVVKAVNKIKKAKGLTGRSGNAYVVATKALGIHAGHPIVGLKSSFYKEAVDRRKFRRALTQDECRILYYSTRDSKVFHSGMTSEDRAMLYLLAVSTGFRRSELYSLRHENFYLEGSPPYIQAKAGYTKNSELATNPIHPVIVPDIRSWLAGKPVGRPLWREWRDTAKMVRRDMVRAGMDTEKMDFHALRGTYITHVSNVASTPLAQVMKLARHQDISTTLRYIDSPFLELAQRVPSAFEGGSPQVSDGVQGEIVPNYLPLKGMSIDQDMMSIDVPTPGDQSRNQIVVLPNPLKNNDLERDGECLAQRVPIDLISDYMNAPTHVQAQVLALLAGYRDSAPPTRRAFPGEGEDA